MKLDGYQLLGLSLTSFGLVFGAYSYEVLLSVPLTSLGVACLVLGLTLLLVPSNPVPTQQIRAMMEGSLVNIEALLEEFNAQGKATYVPSEDRVYAFIPTVEASVKVNPGRTPVRVLTEAGGVPGLIVFPPGSVAVRLASLPEEVGVEDALAHVLVDFLEICESVKAVNEQGRVIVEINNPRTDTEYPRVNRSLGSAAVSVAGCVLARVTGSPVYLQSEDGTDKKVAVFEVDSSG